MQPGESGKIPIKLGTKRGAGPLTKSVRVDTNIPGGSAITLKIKGEVWQAVQVTPRSAAFGRVTVEQAKKGLVRKLTIVNNVEGELKLADLKSTNPAFKVDIEPIEEGKKYELTITTVPPLHPGNNTAQIMLSTGLKEMPALKIPAYAYITSPVDVTPPNLSLPTNRTATFTRQLYVRSNTNTPVKLSDLKATNSEIQLELTDIKQGKMYRLSVTVPPTYEPPPGGDKITVKTDNQEVPLLTVPVVQGRATLAPRRAAGTLNKPTRRVIQSPVAPARKQGTAVQGTLKTGGASQPQARPIGNVPASVKSVQKQKKKATDK